MISINCRGKLLVFDQPKLMGIINATPDSFYRGHGDLDDDALRQKAGNMIREGASILDIGGQSTRPGSVRISAEEELDRVLPAIKLIHTHFPGQIISVDTYSSKVAIAAVETGATIVNDISGGLLDENMLPAVASLRVPFVCMHMKGSPEHMQDDPVYDDVVKTVLDYFIERSEACRLAGINDLILDPGFGFGKTITHNFQLLKGLRTFCMTGRPVLAGLSRKSTVYRTLGVGVEEALNGTTVLNTLALEHGASLLRVHDVKEAHEAIILHEAYKKASCLQDA
ncbi:MAG: dihydropteroate synthase [Chitinophagaceae bacterium]|nr:dihydropteroate synthase [Chitinophagaceae bacterium]